MATFAHHARSLVLVMVIALTAVACGDLNVPAGTGPGPGSGASDPADPSTTGAPSPSAAPEVSHDVEPPVASGAPRFADPSAASEAMPTADLPGWKQVFAEDFTDGYSLTTDDWRFNIRSSNTEPLLRLNIEARKPGLVEKMLAEIEPIIGSKPH